MSDLCYRWAACVGGGLVRPDGWGDRSSRWSRAGGGEMPGLKVLCMVLDHATHCSAKFNSVDRRALEAFSETPMHGISENTREEVRNDLPRRRSQVEAQTRMTQKSKLWWDQTHLLKKWALIMADLVDLGRDWATVRFGSARTGSGREASRVCRPEGNRMSMCNSCLTLVAESEIGEGGRSSSFKLLRQTLIPELPYLSPDPPAAGGARILADLAVSFADFARSHWKNSNSPGKSAAELVLPESQTVRSQQIRGGIVEMMRKTLPKGLRWWAKWRDEPHEISLSRKKLNLEGEGVRGNPSPRWPPLLIPMIRDWEKKIWGRKCCRFLITH